MGNIKFIDIDAATEKLTFVDGVKCCLFCALFFGVWLFANCSAIDTFSKKKAMVLTAEEKVRRFDFETAKNLCLRTPEYQTMICKEKECAEETQGPMDYWYRGYCENERPNFAALAVLENQSCLSDYKGEGLPCTSRYRIISVLDAVVSITLKDGYLEAKEERLLPRFWYRPLLIFGNSNDEVVQIEGYEDVREYFSRKIDVFRERIKIDPDNCGNVLCAEFFANMAAAAITNNRAFIEMEKHFPRPCPIFIEILEATDDDTPKR
jgi:hypothetical protein